MPRLLKQVLMAVLTLVVYSIVFNWKMALMLCIAISWHEYCHILAAKKCNITTSGFYLIPMVGGVALMNDSPKTRAEQVFISIMGPVGGGSLGVIAYFVYLITHIPLVGTLALSLILINLFNLVPLSILDGGQILNCITYSLNRTFGFIIHIVTTITGVVLLYFVNPFVASFVALLGVPSLIREGMDYKHYRRGNFHLVSESYLNPMKKLSYKGILVTILCWISVIVLYSYITFSIVKDQIPLSLK